MQAQPTNETEVLPIALAPAQIALDEIGEGRWILLEAASLLGQHPHLPAGTTHQHRLHLVVAEYAPAEGRRARQGRKPAVRHERCHADHRVVAPIGPTVALPPGAPDRVGAHAVAHAELEDPRERAGTGQADDQLLQDADPGLLDHDAHQPHDRRARHDAVRIQHQHEVEPGAVELEKIPEIAGLVAVIVDAAAIVQTLRTTGSPSPAFERRNLGDRDLRDPCIAEEKRFEVERDAGCIQAGDRLLEVSDHARRLLVAHWHHKCETNRQRLVPGRGRPRKDMRVSDCVRR